MPVPAQYTSRSGADSFMKFAQTMCRIVNASAPVIRERFPDRVDLLALLSAAEALCPLLPAAQSEAALADAEDAPAFNPGDAVLVPGQDTL